jgi:hypothetical protein
MKMSKEKNTQIYVSLDTKTRERLESLADHQERSLSKMAFILIKKGLEEAENAKA